MDHAYEWIFSGIGVAVIGWIGAAVYRHSKSKSAPPQPAPTSGSTVGMVVVNMGNATNPIINAGTGSVEQGVSAVQPAEPTQPVSITRVAPITLKQIRQAIESAPPLQRPGVTRHYVGITVQWRTALVSATRGTNDPDDIRLLLKVKEDVISAHLTCHVRLSQYRELGILQEGAPITVSGRIRDIDGLFVGLEDAQLFFNDPVGDLRA